jgi:hypothetical protein
MPKNPDRPKIKFKRVGIKARKPKRKKTPEQLAEKRLAKLERRYHLTPSKVAVLILKERGLLTYVCRALKMPRTTLVHYIERYPECIEALDHARNAMGDKAEQKLYELIDAGDVRCILYYLSTVQRHRGYGLNANAINSESGGNDNRQVFVETVNIVGVPPGTYLPKEIAAPDNSAVIDN